MLVDSGNSFIDKGTAPELTAQTTIKGMNLLQYDALNIGQGELSLGIEFLQQLQKDALFPLVSANIFLKENGRPLGEQFLIKNFSGITVGITGVVSPALVQDRSPSAAFLTIEDPLKALERIVPELRKRSDVVILLSHVGGPYTNVLVRKIPGIDVAVVGNHRGAEAQPEQVGTTLVLKNCNKGQYIGVLHLSLGAKGKIINAENSLDKIAGTIALDPEANTLVKEYKIAKGQTTKEKQLNARRQKMHEQLMEQLNTLSPEEFIEQMKKSAPHPAAPPSPD